MMGVPNVFLLDNGSLFASSVTQDFFKGWGVEWRPSLSYNPSSNGHAVKHEELQVSPRQVPMGVGIGRVLVWIIGPPKYTAIGWTDYLDVPSGQNYLFIGKLFCPNFRFRPINPMPSTFKMIPLERLIMIKRQALGKRFPLATLSLPRIQPRDDGIEMALLLKTNLLGVI